MLLFAQVEQPCLAFFERASARSAWPAKRAEGLVPDARRDSRGGTRSPKGLEAEIRLQIHKVGIRGTKRTGAQGL